MFALRFLSDSCWCYPNLIYGNSEGQCWILLSKVQRNRVIPNIKAFAPTIKPYHLLLKLSYYCKGILHFRWITSSVYFVIFLREAHSGIFRTQAFFCESKFSQTEKGTEARCLILWASAQPLNKKKGSATCPLTCWFLNPTFSGLTLNIEVFAFV